MISKFIRTFVLVWMSVPALVACTSSLETDEHHFQSSEVSCSLHSLPGTTEALQELGRGWYHNKSEADLNAIASRVMDYANQGDPAAMLAWGAIKQQSILKKLIKNKADRLAVRFYPDESRADMARAMVYALIVLGAGGEHRAMARSSLRAIEHGIEPVLTIPAEWISEAEADAAQWSAQCQLPVPNFTRDVAPFSPEKLSCKSHEISEAREKIEAIKNHPDGDLYFISHVDEIFDDLRKYADEGDPQAMYFIGSLKYEAALISQIDNLDARRISRPFPDYTKPDLIAAMTYVLASAEMKGKHWEYVHEFVQKIERRSESNPFIPAAWIEEAKANVKQWQKLCSSR